MLDKRKEEDKMSKDVEQLAAAHVVWFLKTIKPLLIEHFIHGYKHGREDK